ncbi:MAG TPA: HAMP domain-containing sensor histidine kinase [Acidimicrobiia bacterium]|nr:HAMP domain-containing sensor histidine kinase [Acidimicrobiia bacterium]
MTRDRRARRTLTVRVVGAIVGVAVVVLGLSYATTYLLVRAELQENALSNLRSRSAELRPLVARLAATSDLRGAELAAGLGGLKRDLRAGLRITGMSAVLVSPTGAVNDRPTAPVFSLPSSLQPSDLDAQRLLSGQDVSGRRGNTVFLALPARGLRARGQLLVVVATDRVETTVLSRAMPWLVAAGLVVLGLAAAVAVVLARRLTRPIREIERAAAQLASGDLSARADVPPGTDGELTALGGTLNEMASQLEHARGSQRTFLLSISHDLRTPLTSIRGYAEALADGTLDDADPEARKRAATVIGGEARRLERLVRDLLDLSRLDSHEFSLRPRPCDLAEIVADAAEAFAPQAHDLGLVLRSSTATALPVELDPERLAQIVANLVENALKYATSTIAVSANVVDGGQYVIVVTDDGPGIAPDELSHVFDRLYTVRSSPGRSVGTGLGLAIVRQLAAAMGGTATVETPADGGTRFVVSLAADATNVAANASVP